MQRDQQQQAAAQKVTWIGAALNLILGIIKIFVGQVANSTALIADGVHSLSDLLSDILIVAILRISGKGPDREHPWGHGYFETIGTAILGCLLIAVAGAMAYEGATQLFSHRELLSPEWPALLVAGISILGKEWIFRYTLSIGKKLKSDLLIANAWHSRTDALSSIIVFIGVAGAMSGFEWLDSLATVAVALLIAKIGWDLSWSSLKQLVNTALPQDEIDKYCEQILAVDGVVNVHDFKTRMIANKKVLELHLQIHPAMSASEGHYIGQQVCKVLMVDPDIGHIIYHIDTTDDAGEQIDLPDGNALPSRQLLEPLVTDTLSSLDTDIELYRLAIFYQSTSVDLDVLIRCPQPSTLEKQGLTPNQMVSAIRNRIQSENDGAPWLGKIFIAVGDKG
ncbi:cation diffusion facilitator family transporter [Neptuniibacter caesariensis]|uniref:Cation-efflux family protein n=1 Tax=Neptuniibacter caesariensis TaxID=207954 RepID=A0A7U8C7K4_NEPCE|nr:cation diffusion facilitator family transporter [Neptuniibacter caesariensis]EAR61674.1 cation-efflux family protein [Neptuniibacter caesariensis]